MTVSTDIEDSRIAAERGCLSTGIVLAVVTITALWPLAHFVPPPSPSQSAEFFADYYRTNTMGIRFAALLLMLGGCLYAPFFGALAAQVRRMEGGQSGVWTYTLLLSTAVASATFFLSGMFFGLASFRPERSVEIQSVLNDLAWFELVIPAIPATVQAFALGLAILSAPDSARAQPRWLGYANLWFGMLFLPGCAIMLFKTGPFAWSGLFAFWIPGIFFVLWLGLMTWAGWRGAAQLRSPQ